MIVLRIFMLKIVVFTKKKIKWVLFLDLNSVKNQQKQKKYSNPYYFYFLHFFYTIPIFFFKTPNSVFKHRFLFYTVYCAGVIFGNFGSSPECKCKCKKKYTALQCLLKHKTLESFSERFYRNWLRIFGKFWSWAKKNRLIT
jgi:hypothetical protein